MANIGCFKNVYQMTTAVTSVNNDISTMINYTSTLSNTSIILYDKSSSFCDITLSKRSRGLVAWLNLMENHNLMESTCHLGDNCIVFENFTTSIGDLMVANWVYWRRVSGASKRIFATMKSTIRQLMPWNFQIQYSYLHSNVIMCIATLLTRWRKR